MHSWLFSYCSENKFWLIDWLIDKVREWEVGVIFPILFPFHPFPHSLIIPASIIIISENKSNRLTSTIKWDKILVVCNVIKFRKQKSCLSSSWGPESCYLSRRLSVNTDYACSPNVSDVCDTSKASLSADHRFGCHVVMYCSRSEM